MDVDDLLRRKTDSAFRDLRLRGDGRIEHGEFESSPMGWARSSATDPAIHDHYFDHDPDGVGRWLLGALAH
ncbi:hypothetical protein [Nocardia aurantiaca]|uniref:hypothetical protein n=1 Tax=Nocardia aurantiaca TaxID=2675850 RepID=UPI0018A8B776|nr:hypothetical protein [Nocardia aurantiaca]